MTSIQSSTFGACPYNTIIFQEGLDIGLTKLNCNLSLKAQSLVIYIVDVFQPIDKNQDNYLSLNLINI